MDGALNVLELKRVSKKFDSVPAVTDCTLSVLAGEFITLLGPSGCGKTTTLRLIAGFLRPDEGEILFDGNAASSPAAHLPPERRNIGMVFQSYAIWPHMSVWENIALPLKIRKIGASEIARRCDEMLRLCRLEGLGKREPHQLSGGQLQRVALARALAYNPRLVLLDEPLSNLDATLREEVRRELKAIHQAIKTTFVLVTHDQAEAMLLSDRVVVMNSGRIEQVGSPEEVYGDPRSEFVAGFVGGANLLKGRVRDVQSGDQHVVSRVTVQGLDMTARRRSKVRTGSECCVAIHPESIRVTRSVREAEAAENTYNGVVKKSYFVGRTHEAVIDVGGVDLRSIFIGNERFEVGERVEVMIPPQGVIIF